MMRIGRSAESKAAELDRARAAARVRIEGLINPVRLAQLTNLAGQEMLYLEKRREVEAIKAAPGQTLDPALVPLIASEMEGRGETMAQVLARNEVTASGWKEFVAPLERLRYHCNTQIGAAADDAAIAAVIDYARAALEDFNAL